MNHYLTIRDQERQAVAALSTNKAGIAWQDNDNCIRALLHAEVGDCQPQKGK